MKRIDLSGTPPARVGDRFMEQRRSSEGHDYDVWTVSIVHPDRWIEMTRPKDDYRWRMGWDNFSEIRLKGALTRIP